ncbi:DUF4097 family beta strand repeat-containing protein [Xylocopilactobacillus apis]|uniref:Adhesin domain-containing protein n=1 Tax=Xylocopilactobacillus apis TaxID=2932183 RepID=A0AAU9CZW8_9LACO|nr:DUF4097 family beta strand repeat-containing protein [Xylocopilactobacillus apis]BDR55811.1 hypothetical protein KIMC2_03730 [Xylocopilactobacillus apis]
MDERKRIMDLVKKGVITSEEAIVLLEKLGEESAEGTGEDAYNYNTKKTTYQNDESSDYIDNLKKRIEQVKERLTVLNTLDDFERLNDEEAAERDDLERSLAELQAELVKAEKERKTMDSQDDRKFFGMDFDIDTDGLEEQARHLASKVKEGVKNISNNFELRDFNVKIPGFARSKKITNNYEYDASRVKVLTVKNFNGDIIINKSDDNQIHERITYRVYGNIRNSSAEDFFKNNTVNELNGSTLNIKMHHRIEATIEINIPSETSLSSVNLRCKNGSFDLNDLEVDDLVVAATNGTVFLNQADVDHLEINNVNGSIKVEQSTLRNGLLNTVNGSIKTLDSLTDVELSSVNGSIILSHLSKYSKNVDAHVVNGTVKISVPVELGYVIKAETKNGSINNRLSDINVLSSEKNNRIVKLEHLGAGAADLQVSTISGSVYLKDSLTEEDK